MVNTRIRNGAFPRPNKCAKCQVTWHTKLAIDQDKWAAETYRANFPDTRVECAPVAMFIEMLPDADLVIGGPPCQPHSLAGKRGASSDSRDGGVDFVNVVDAVQPRGFLMENVAGLMSSEKGRYAQRLLANMEAAGYVVQIKTMDSVNYGVPQFRNRCWWWGIRRDLYVDGIRHCWPVPTHAWPPPQPSMFGDPGLLPAVTMRQACNFSWWAYECNTSYSGSRKPQNPNRPAPTACGSGNTLGGLLVSTQRGSEPWRLDRPSICVCSTEDAGAGHQKYDVNKSPMRVGDVLWRGAGIRRASVSELMRLQSAPDDFVWPQGITKKAKYAITGNGWASKMAWEMQGSLRKSDPDARTLIDLYCGGGLGAVGFHGRYWSYQLKMEGVVVQ